MNRLLKVFSRNKPLTIVTLLIISFLVSAKSTYAISPVFITNPANEYVQNNTLNIILRDDPNGTLNYRIHLEKMEPSSAVYSSIGYVQVTSANKTLHYDIPNGTPSNTKFRYKVTVQDPDTSVWSTDSNTLVFTYINVTSAEISVRPQPSYSWSPESIEANVFFEGEPELLAGAIKRYEVTNSSTFPSTFTNILPSSGIINLSNNGENYIHVQFELSFGAVVTETVGPYKIDLSPINDFSFTLEDSSGTAINNWTNQNLNIDISLPPNSGASDLQRQYKVEGFHSEWVDYRGNETIDMEGEYRVFARVKNEAGTTSEEKYVLARIDKAIPSFNSIILTRSTNQSGSTVYSVDTNVSEKESGVNRVRLSNGATLIRNGATLDFSIANVTTIPTFLEVIDNAGNTTGPITFLDVPSITYQTGYSKTAPTYKSELQATIDGSGSLSYLFGKRSYSCETAPCAVTIERNTTFTAVNQSGLKSSKYVEEISNIDTDPVRLVLNGQRDATDTKKISFEWNHPLTSPTITCDYSTGIETISPSAGVQQYDFLNAYNYSYACTLVGVIHGNEETSNTISVYPDYNKGVTVPTGINVAEVTLTEESNIQYEESLLGRTYFINTRKNNLTTKTIPLPAAIFQ